MSGGHEPHDQSDNWQQDDNKTPDDLATHLDTTSPDLHDGYQISYQHDQGQQRTPGFHRSVPQVALIRPIATRPHDAPDDQAQHWQDDDQQHPESFFPGAAVASHHADDCPDIQCQDKQAENTAEGIGHDKTPNYSEFVIRMPGGFEGSVRDLLTARIVRLEAGERWMISQLTPSHSRPQVCRHCCAASSSSYIEEKENPVGLQADRARNTWEQHVEDGPHGAGDVFDIGKDGFAGIRSHQGAENGRQCLPR